MSANEIIFIVEERLDGGYTAYALGQSIFTEADNWAALKDAIRDAVKCHFEEKDRPHIVTLHAVREERLAV